MPQETGWRNESAYHRAKAPDHKRGRTRRTKVSKEIIPRDTSEKDELDFQRAEEKHVTNSIAQE